MPTDMSFSTAKTDFEQLKTCVIIPTFNNGGTVGSVIQDVLQYTQHVIVVNDGSTDNTGEILKAIRGIHVISYTKNRGKGWALRKAFKVAFDKGYRTAITMDADGQHFAQDLILFIDKLKNEADVIIMGARNMNHESVPGKSSFGHKFSNFWFKLETGINCPDTQTGFRSYPLHRLHGMRFYSVKYEFEIEVIVRAAWKGIKFDAVPIKVYYAPKETRISHFRPFKDFTRISILNTIFVLITLLYIKPRNFFRTLFNKKKLKQAINEQLFNPQQTDLLKAFSIAFGIFMGIIPIWGFQLAVGIFLSVLFRLNTALVVIAANISIPPMIPLIIFCSYKMGALWMDGGEVNMLFNSDLSLESIRNNLEQYIYGSITLAVVAAFITGLLSYVAMRLLKRKPVLAGS